MSPGEARPLSPTDISAHLACNHLTHLEHLRRNHQLQVALHSDPRLEAMIQRGIEHEEQYVQELEREGLRVVRLPSSRDPAITLAAMQDGVDVIVQAPLGNGAMAGIADVLRRVAVPCAAFGNYSYEAVDTKLTNHTKAGTILQLCTYSVLLEELQGCLPERFWVVTPSERQAYRTRDYTAYFRVVRDQLIAARTSDSATLTYPEPVDHCDVCRYWQHCQQQRVADDHLSLVAGLHATHRRECERQGVATMASLAASEGVLPELPERGTAATYLRLGQQARLQVASKGLTIPLLEHLPIEASRGFCRLPEPCAGDVFLDFEGDPFVGDCGLEYLTGWTTREHGTSQYVQHWALRGSDEKAALVAFLEHVQAARVRHPGMHIYHFGAYEPAALTRLCGRHDTHGEVLDELLRAGCFIDLHSVVRQALRIGIDRYGLKQMEVLHGFVRTFDLREAALACRDLELALELHHEAVIDADLRTRVAAYNREDCESTEGLRNWLEQQRQLAIEAGCEIARPELRDGVSDENTSARDRRIAAAKQALFAQLPEDPETYDDDEQAIALLANVLGYFRQEEKNAWVEHFRLRELEEHEHLQEREVLAELQFVENLPKTRGQRNVRYVFRFPPQESAVEVGRSACYLACDDPAENKTTSVSVDAIDYEARLVTLSLNAAAAAAPPRAVFRDQVVGASALEKSLLAFAEHVQSRGLADTSEYQAARQLLCRGPPRRGAATGEPVRKPGESTLDATVRACLELRGGVLAIQGPPGTGKTFTGSRAILELMRAGKCVGITAVSHKVIDNLLLGVAKAAEQAGIAITLMHKAKGTPPTGISYVDDNNQVLGSISTSTVVGGTAWLWANDAALEQLDYLFVDEAGQMSLAQVLAAARSTKNLVLLGDPQQLEQPRRGAHPGGAEVAALVHIVGKDRQTIGEHQGLFLDRTWRLHPNICAFTSELYYGGLLQPIEACGLQRIDGTDVIDGAGLFLHEVAHRGNQASAPEEVLVIAKLVRQFLNANATRTDMAGAVSALTADDILVIAPYNSQVNALRRALMPLGVHQVGTVDKFQGREAAIVIYSCTSSSPLDAPRGMSFLYDPHRLNVASSRARCAFLMVASPALFTPEVKTPEQMHWANGMCRFRELAQRI